MVELRRPDEKTTPVSANQAIIRNVKGRFVTSKTLKKSMNKATAMSKARTIFGVKRKLAYGSDENELESDDTSAQETFKRRKRECQVNF